MTNERKTILVVEDEAAMRRALHDKLTREGYDVVEAVNGEEGLKLALAGHPDLILLDIAMPKVDGETMLQWLREDAWGKNVPVIILSNLSYLPKHHDHSKQMAMEYYLKADMPLAELVVKIKQHLS